MLTQKQEQFLSKIPEDVFVQVKPWDAETAKYATSLVNDIESTGLEVFWEGSLALGIPGENDIDLYIFSTPKDFDRYLPSIVHFLGDPTYILPEKILWRIKKDGHKIDASLAEKSSPEVAMDMHFYGSLKKSPALLAEYIGLKSVGLSAKEYYSRKNEFYNKITGNK